MAHLFTQAESGDWAAVSLAAGEYSLHADPKSPVRRAVEEGARETLQIVGDDSSQSGWSLLVGDRFGTTWLNGVPLLTGMRILRNQDEIRTHNGLHAFFSNERIATVQPFPGFAGREARCPRCKRAIEAADPAVQCPGCGIWYHELADTRECWSRGQVCETCKCRAELNGSLSWTPMDL